MKPAASRNEEEGESIVKYVNALHTLVQSCNFFLCSHYEQLHNSLAAPKPLYLALESSDRNFNLK